MNKDLQASISGIIGGLSFLIHYLGGPSIPGWVTAVIGSAALAYLGYVTNKVDPTDMSGNLPK